MNCTIKCDGEMHGAHLYIETQPDSDLVLMQNIVKLAQARLSRMHSLPCSSCMFFEKGSFKDCVQNDMDCHHLRIIDAI